VVSQIHDGGPGWATDGVVPAAVPLPCRSSSCTSSRSTSGLRCESRRVISIAHQFFFFAPLPASARACFAINCRYRASRSERK
jgi:hypothetical protein